MKYRILNWLAKRYGYTLEKDSRCAIDVYCEDARMIRMATVISPEKTREIAILQGKVLTPGDRVKVYINN